MGGTCSTHGRNEELLDCFMSGNRGHFVSTGLVRRIIIIRNLEKHVKVLTGLKWVRREGPVVDFCENG
jgi:hypothetical protein